MSTKAQGSGNLKRTVQKAILLAAQGKMEEALDVYKELTGLPDPPEDEEGLFQYIRAFVNSGILLNRLGNPAQALQHWQKARRVSELAPRNQEVQAAALKTLIFIAHTYPEGQRTAFLKDLMIKALETSMSMVHQVYWDLVAGNESLESWEFPLGHSGADAQDKSLPCWAFIGLNKRRSEHPQLEDFGRFYFSLKASLRPLLWANPQLQSWCKEYFTSALSPSVWYDWEKEKMLALGVSRNSEVSAELKVQFHKSSSFPPGPIKGLAPLKNGGWTWVSEKGLLSFTQKNPEGFGPGESQHLDLEMKIKTALQSSTWGWFFISNTNPCWALRFYQGILKKKPLSASFTDILLLQNQALFYNSQGANWTWDYETDEWLQGEPLPLGVWRKALVLDSGKAVFGCEDGRILIWNMGHGHEIQVLNGPIEALAKAGSTLLVAGEADEVLAFTESDLERGKASQRYPVAGPVNFTAFNGSFAFLAGPKWSGCYDSEKKLWKDIPLKSPVTCASLSSSGEVFYADQKNRAHWKNRSWVSLPDWGSHSSFSLQKDETRGLATLDGSLWVWEKQNPTPHNWGFQSVKWVHELGSGWAVSGTYNLNQYSLEGRPLGSLDFQGVPFTSWAVSGNWVIAGSLKGHLAFAELGASEWQQNYQLDEPVLGIQVLPQGVGVHTLKGQFLFFPLPGKNKEWKPIVSGYWDYGLVAGACWMRDDRVFVWGPEAKPLLIFNPQDNRAVVDLTGNHHKSILDAWWEKQDRLWISSGDGKIVVWDIQTTEIVDLLQDEGEAVIRFLPCSRCVIGLTGGRNPMIFHLAGVRESQSLRGHRGKLLDLAVGKTQEILSSGEDSTLRRYALPEGRNLGKITLDQPVVKLASHSEGLRYLGVLKDGSLIFLGVS